MSAATQPAYVWEKLPWRTIQVGVFKLQKRIYQASRRGDTARVHKLQKLLIGSWTARCLAVRTVTQDNRGKRTAGVDGKASLTPHQRLCLIDELALSGNALPVRRVWIPKPGKAEKRPLGIPTIAERAKQALLKLALEPEWEARFEPNSYGFRPGRGAHDAIEAIFKAINRQPRYVLDADIKSCFDRIGHEPLLQKLNTFRAARRQIRAWLKAGIFEEGRLFPSEAGTPQGGVISPLLANVALHGLEDAIKQAFPVRRITLKPGKRWKDKDGPLKERWRPMVVRYADDFVILHHDLDTLLETKKIAETWLRGSGLELSPTKTAIRHTLRSHEGSPPGFVFLGFTVRQFNSMQRVLGYKTLIKPSRSSVQKHLADLKSYLRGRKDASQEEVIRKLNPKISGWARYFSTVCSKELFGDLNREMWLKLYAWARRKHYGQSRKKIVNLYWKRWRFTTGIYHLNRHGDTRIVRHTKVKGDRSVFDGDEVYWSTRLGRSPILPATTAVLMKRQGGRCSRCGLRFDHIGNVEKHHVRKLVENGPKQMTNLVLVHGHCHDREHAGRPEVPDDNGLRRRGAG